MQISSGRRAKAQKVVIYGPEGIGKSSFAAQFPNALFIDTEGSTDNMDVDRFDDRPSSWEMLNQQVDWVKNNRPCKTLIIDTIDWAEHLGIAQIVSNANKKSITNFNYGEGFIQLEETMGRFLNKLSDLIDMGINIVLTAHTKITRFEAPDEMGAYDRYELKLGNKTTAKTAALVKEWADMVLFLNYKVYSVATDEKGKKFKGQGGERRMHATHHPAWDAKNRHGLPDEMPMDYGQIAHIFVPAPNQAEPVQQEPPVQTNAEPVQQTQQANPQKPVANETATVPNPEPVQPETAQPQQEPYIEGEELNPNIPQALRDLMSLHKVQESEIQIVVGQKGYYPKNTPIMNYDEQFIQGVLVGAWDQVYGMVEEFRKSIPFK